MQNQPTRPTHHPAPLQTCLRLDNREQQQRYPQQQLGERGRKEGRIEGGLSSIERVPKGSNELELSGAEEGAHSRLAER